VSNQLQIFLQNEQLNLPDVVHLVAIFFFSLTGALAAMQRRYDLVGVFVLALVVGAGGGLIRDGILIRQGPSMIMQDWRVLPTVAAACVVGLMVNHWISRFEKAIAVLDAVGLSIYSMVGLFKATAAGLSVPAAVLVGVVNAAGGGLLRDVLVREEPLVFKPGQFYVLASLAGCLVFVLLAYESWLMPRNAAGIAMATIFVLRILAIQFNWKTRPLEPWLPGSLSRKAASADPQKMP
jgi:uncharacterized membrane protein YeiH